MSIWDKRMPTLLGLILIVIGIAGTSYLVQIGAIPFLHAAPPETPTNIRVTNVSDESFTVTYTTEASVIGSINLTKQDGQNQVILDDRDQASGTPTFHQVHSITAHSLKPKTDYSFTITSGTKTFQNNQTSFTITTGQTISDPPSSEDPLAGRVILPDGSPPSEALVYATTTDGQTLSAIVKATGLYVIPLNSMRTANFSSYIVFNAKTTLQLLWSTNTLTSKANILASERNPVPTVTLSNDYDFTTQTNPIASTSAIVLNFPSFALDNTVQAAPIAITNPTKNETFTDAQPVLQGKAQPNATVSIEIHSDTAITTNVTADTNGNWKYRPTTPLAPGQHTITITTKDQFGILQTLKQTFTIFASGSQVAEAATPSATIVPPTATPKPQATATPTPNIVATGTVVPTQAAQPTPTTAQLQLSVSPTPTTKGGLPATGNGSVITAGVMGIVTITVGVVLFIITRGASTL
jgi:hypothetical protein